MGKHFLFDGKNLEWWHVILFIGILVALYMWFLAPEEEVILEGTVTDDGRCTSRTGADLVICCLAEDPDTGEFTMVPCELAEPQALLQIDEGEEYIIPSAVCFAIKVTNTGNVELDFDVLAASTTPSNGGDNAGAQEWDNSWADLVALPVEYDVPEGDFVEFSMDCYDNPVRLNTENPYFVMTDGRYTSTIDVRADAPGGEHATNQKVIIFDVAQEDLGFTIDLQMI